MELSQSQSDDVLLYDREGRLFAILRPSNRTAVIANGLGELGAYIEPHQDGGGAVRIYKHERPLIALRFGQEWPHVEIFPSHALHGAEPN